MRKQRVRRTAILASSLLAAGCGEVPEPSRPPLPPSDRPPAGEVRADENELWLDAVTAERFARRVPFTWTTPDQIEELRRDRLRTAFA